MKCAKPISPGVLGSTMFGCGQCMQCRINKRREWTTRQVLESFCHDHSSFVTLTYNDEFLPKGRTLVPDHPVLFLKRFRKALSGIPHGPKVRFFLVGEYGDETHRPHYHLSMFGIGPEQWALVEDCWTHPRSKKPYGHVKSMEFHPRTAAYVGGYVTKKMTKAGDPRLGLKHPEYARQSRNPGLGRDALDVIVDAMATDFGMDELLHTGDVPMAVKMGNQSMPLGGYLRRMLRDDIGMDDEMRAKVLERFQLEQETLVNVLREQYSDLKPVYTGHPDEETRPLEVNYIPYTDCEIVEMANRQHTRNLDARERIQRSKRNQL